MSSNEIPVKLLNIDPLTRALYQVLYHPVIAPFHANAFHFSHKVITSTFRAAVLTVFIGFDCYIDRATEQP
ncbi:MAG TPA: hypothetical protein PKH78_01765 [Candidatus Obscuribacter sp.]|nr:hypothetical protein [Candidatus Obscuribacter sp.]MBK9276636.1 hypothetical protein [Candidatus Obscuribacter sp.]MBL8082751.1 hypothetical protein [Candidatus Obscuribacter sp.]HMY51449.1 hypothetical protein [Candidatus Obscuribacter sp.]HND65826.1 hypothetical protein [Candidatus Obscuribacter sp.]